jgi:MarR family transcriptional regulator, 2-MHQ and catechol-resistance regulon repressor
VAKKGRERPILTGFGKRSRRPTHQENTQRAFRVYLELIETADWLRREMRAPLEAFDLTMLEFRVLEMLYREGALTAPQIGARIGRPRQSVDVLTARLQGRGWVGRMIMNLPPVPREDAHLRKADQDTERQGRRLSVVGLTASGKKFMGNVLPRHAKVVKALMRAIDAREKDSIVRACRKLRRGDAVKFLTEMSFGDVEED